MRAFSVLAAVLVLMSACTGELLLEDVPSGEPAKEARASDMEATIRIEIILKHNQ